MSNTLLVGKQKVNPKVIYHKVNLDNHGDMHEYETRLTNLRRLLRDQFDGKQVDLASAIPCEANYLSRLLKGTKRLGENLARKIEASLGLERGWLDRQHDPEAVELATLHNSFAEFSKVPLVSWVQAGAWCGIADPYAIGDAEKWLACQKPHDSRTFALTVRGISMEPKFEEGDVIFVDPGREPKNKCYVVVRLDDDQEATFKQLIIEGNRRYLQPLNKNWPEQIIELKSPATLCGVVIGKYTTFE